MDSVRFVLGSRSMTVKPTLYERKIQRSVGEDIFARLQCLSDRPPTLWCYSLQLEKGGMLLHDVVGVNCKRGASTEIKARTGT